MLNFKELEKVLSADPALGRAYKGRPLRTGLVWIEEYAEWPQAGGPTYLEATGRVLEVLFVPQGEMSTVVPLRVLWNV